MVMVDVPLVVCVSSDMAVRERLIRQLDSCGPVLICADLDELRAILFPELMGDAEPVDPGLVLHADVDPDGVSTALLQVGELIIDPGGYRVTWRGQPLQVTRLERRLLRCLATPPQDVWTYQRLFHAVWGSAYLGDTSILHSAVKRLRSKLQAVGRELAIETVRGVGYRLAVRP